ncbi:RNaseH domain-containing protein (plasmid) [Deinococcus radiomollis]|uniref:RNaseH domain-containing protein n=1 Tax=Deinococcus radiomollis TaxID=468916 RepID=UPI003892BCC0
MLCIFKAKRGISSYRDTLNECGVVTVPRNDAWLTPNAIEITVIRPGPHDPQELAKFVEALRSEFAHFGSWINNPGPLHFASLLKDYIPDYELAQEKDDSEEVIQDMQPGLFG